MYKLSAHTLYIQDRPYLFFEVVSSAIFLMIYLGIGHLLLWIYYLFCTGRDYAPDYPAFQEDISFSFFF
ncbi:hypothetical protein DXN04_19240 [Chitinophaga silvisoli]|uniref:Uncharacterized protein n=1 Tax=Chitinophaga silvisoli TaxID=2291814 RepID=A0A3E1NYY3_9BACT|nr:hypothetical protein DXN04_19240 [Chitinophaga silvisoli]